MHACQRRENRNHKHTTHILSPFMQQVESVKEEMIPGSGIGIMEN